MGKKDYYIVEKNINKIIRGEYTNFLDPSTRIKVCNKLKGHTYNIYYPYQDSDKTIVYYNQIPQIKLLEIVTCFKKNENSLLLQNFSNKVLIKTNHEMNFKNKEDCSMIHQGITYLMNNKDDDILY